jgi:hypothetical protein
MSPILGGLLSGQILIAIGTPNELPILIGGRQSISAQI